MTLRSVLLCCGALAAVCFVPPVRVATLPEVRSIDTAGRDRPVPREFAYVVAPRRDEVTLLAPFHDLAYAAADASPVGCLWLLGGVVLLAFVRGLWSQGVRGALRRAVLAVALGAPAIVGLLYLSSLLDGRMIHLGPEAADYVPASLHNHTDVSTGLLSPRQVVIWHLKRGFRVLNISDKDSIRGGLRGREAYRRLEEDEGPIEPRLVVVVGDEWHGQPDIVFVNTTTAPPLPPEPPAGASREERHVLRLEHLTELAVRVHAEGGALFLAHPWSKVPGEMTIEEIFDAGLDGVEVVNGVIHGGEGRVQAAVEAKKSLFGVIDYKYGPHVTAMTLLDERLAQSPEGVARAVREGRRLVLYAIPGGARSSEEWKAAQVGLRGAMEGLDSLREAPRERRAVWFGWGAALLAIWCVATRREEGLGKHAARVLFLACAAAELLLLLFLWSNVRFVVGTVPVPILLGAHAALAVPLLAASHSLAILERRH
ncbi:MAG TPA: hypothetical protein VFY93_03305 [Planctomycetota bacterium]|nr:hypothetical protein [Planctomycetota bacterium]